MDVEMTDNKDKNDKSNLPLIEKYRPKYISEMVSHEEILNTLNLFIENKNLPHLLFHGPPGTGKTSCILAIARELYGDHYDKMTLELNASDDRGINVVRERIKEFCNSMSLLKKGTKLVILDESDMMTSTAQFALRRLIEKYTKNARFCLICNQVSKIIPAIQSRCMRFRFSPLKKEQCWQRIKEICNKENISIDQISIEKLVEIGRGDMRRILNTLESTYMSFNQVNIKNIYLCTGLPSDEDVNKIFNIVSQNEFDQAYKILLDLKNNNGYSLNDIVLSVLKRVRAVKMKPIIKSTIYKKFQKMDLLNNTGGSEKIILSNLITIIDDIKNK